MTGAFILCANALSTLSEGLGRNIGSNFAAIIAEFRPLIELAFPGIVTLPEDSDWKARYAGADTLLELSRQGE